MDFDLSEEQRLLKESVDGLLNDSYDFDARKKYRSEKGGWNDKNIAAILLNDTPEPANLTPGPGVP